jgi:hypothetical protein
MSSINPKRKDVGKKIYLSVHGIGSENSPGGRSVVAIDFSLKNNTIIGNCKTQLWFYILHCSTLILL